MRETLPAYDFKNFKGLYTKSSPDILSPEQLRVAENTDLFETYGAIAKIKGNKRILAAIYKESGTAKPVSWVGFYKAPDLDGTILRHVLIAAGTTIQRIESGGTLTELVTGRTSGLFHTFDILDKFMLITNQDPQNEGIGDQLIKYDGAVITNWGIVPPGSQEKIIDTWPSANISKWLPSNAITAFDSDVTFDGDAIKVTKERTTRDDFYIERELGKDTFYPVADSRTSGVIANRVQVITYIPRGQITNLAQNDAFSAWFGQDANLIDNFWRFDFDIGNFVEGFNTVQFDFAGAEPGSRSTAPDGTTSGTFYPQGNDEIRTVRFQFRGKTDATNVNNLRLDRLVRLDQGSPVATPGTGNGSGTVFSGTYQYKVTFVSKYGNESNSGPASVTATTDGSQDVIELTNIPTSEDPQVTKRRIYRTVGNGTVFLFLDEIDDNVTTTYTDIVPDGSLSNITAPQAGDFSDDNSPPPKGGIVKTWKRTVFLSGDAQNPNSLYFSDDDEPESFPLINVFELDDRITAMYESYSTLIVETETGKWEVTGDNPDFRVDKIIENIGCVGRRAAGSAKLLGYAVDRDGMRTYEGTGVQKIAEPIRDKYEDLNKQNIELIHTVHSRDDNIILQFNPNASKVYDSIFAYQYAVDEVNTGWWSELKLPSGSNLDFLDAEEIEDTDGTFRLYAGGNDGMVYELFREDEKNWVDANGTTYAIVTKFQTPYLRFGQLGIESQGHTGRVKPILIEIRASGDAATWKVTLDTARGIDQMTPNSTTVLNMEFGSNNSLLRYPVPLDQGMQPDEYIRLTLENSEKNVFSRILAIRVYFHVEWGQYPVTAVDNSD